MKYNIIYVDDEPKNLRAFQSVFRREFNIFITESASEGLNYLKRHNMHLIITDQRMPEMSGVEFLKKVSEIIPHPTPCRMILSGYSKTPEISEAKDRYFLSDFVSKPWDPQELKIKINGAIKENYN